jgi:hypothetical protein
VTYIIKYDLQNYLFERIASRLNNCSLYDHQSVR